MHARPTHRPGTTLVALLATLALLLGACSSGEPAASNGGDTDTGDGGGGDTTAPADDTGGETDATEGGGGLSGELTVVTTWTGVEGEAFAAVLDGFTAANPGITLESVQIPFGEINAQLTQQFAAGDPPDVTVIYPGLIRALGGQDLLLDVDDLWDTWVADGEYTESLRAIATAGLDTTTSVWFKGNVNGMIWHRADTLDQLGLQPPESWDDFVGVFEAASQAGMTPITVGGADQWPLTQWADSLVAQVAGSEAFLGLLDNTVAWDDERVVQAFEVFGQIIADYFPDTALDIGFVDATCTWVAGEAAFQNQGAFVTLVAPGSCDESLTPGQDFTFFAVPPFEGGEKTGQFISGDLFAAAAASDSPEAAKALLAYLGSAEAQSIWAERGGYIAPNASVAAEVYPTDLDRQAAALFPRSPDVAALYDIDDYIGGEVQATYRSALQQFVRDQDVDAFIQTMVEVDQRVRGG